MRINITGEIGKRVRYEIEDPKRGLFLSDLFSASELEDLDPGLVSPEAMAADIKQRYQNKGYDDVEVTGRRSLRVEQ